MLASINPLGERGRHQRYPITVTAFIVSSALAGATLGGALGVSGALLAEQRAALVAVSAVALVGLLFDRNAFGWRVPGPKRQVEERWLTTYRGWVYGAGFGLQLGLGFTTIVTTSATWVAFVCALCSGSAQGGIVIGATYGLVRALPVLATATTHDPAQLRALMRRIDGWELRLATATVVVQVAVACVAAAFVFGGT